MVCSKILLPFKVESSFIPRHGYPNHAMAQGQLESREQETGQKRDFVQKAACKLSCTHIEPGTTQDTQQSNLVYESLQEAGSGTTINKLA